MCISKNKSQYFDKKYNLKDFKFQYDSVSIYFLKNDFINFLQEKKIKLDKFKHLTINIFVYDINLNNDVIAKNHLSNYDDENLNIELINKMIDNTLLLINWEYIFKSKIFDVVDISISII